jgi:exosortase
MNTLHIGGRLLRGTTGGSLLLLVVAAGWAYWSSLGLMASSWAHSPEYSHGYLVPLFALVLLWLRRDLLDLDRLRPSWWGLPVIAAAAGLRIVSARYYFEWFDFLSILPLAAGVCLLLGGWHALRWAWPAIAFLFFMIPLPHTLEVALREPLRWIGTKVSVYAMQTAGLPALAQGHVIVVDDSRIGVNEACSGLRMLMVFFALATAMACVNRHRPLWERLVIILSAVPIAIFVNVVRVVSTGLLHATGHSGLADLVFHDLAGWLMMPLALLLLWLELAIVSRLLLVEDDSPLPLGLAATSSEAGAVRPPLPRTSAHASR